MPTWQNTIFSDCFELLLLLFAYNLIHKINNAQMNQVLWTWIIKINYAE